MKGLLKRLKTIKKRQHLASEIEIIGDPLVDKVKSLIQKDRFSEALSLLSQLKASRIPTRNLDLLRAYCFETQKQPTDAFEAVKEELRHFPDNEPANHVLARLEKAINQDNLIGPEEFQTLYKKLRLYTMVGPARLLSLYQLSKKVCLEDVPGNFVECGVAAGGGSALLAVIIKQFSQRKRRHFAFDTFTGMPDASSLDRHASASPESMGWGAGTCAAPMDSLRKICQDLGVTDLVEPVQGLFADTLPKNRERIGPIAFLHMDGDWYSSTKDILDNIFDQVVDGGIIQIDDYGYWEGCSQAIKEFEAGRGLSFSLHRIDETGVWMVKKVGLPPD